MRCRIAISVVAFLMLFGAFSASAVAHTRSGQTDSGRVDLETQTLVGKRLERVEDGANGQQIHHFIYRVLAQSTQRELPRFTVDPRFSVAYEQEGFREGDSVTLLSTNEVSDTDSPIWIFGVTYEGSGTRQITFSTSGSTLPVSFTIPDCEIDEPCDCVGCIARGNTSCLMGCNCVFCPPCDCLGCQTRDPRCYLCPKGCACDHCVPCNCGGCQSQDPPCFCPTGCTCDHCRCDCEGCQSQDPPCTSCPPGCFCDHCGCLCLDDIDHYGICGCARCTSPNSRCRCDCHVDCP